MLLLPYHKQQLCIFGLYFLIIFPNYVYTTTNRKTAFSKDNSVLSGNLTCNHEHGIRNEIECVRVAARKKKCIAKHNESDPPRCEIYCMSHQTGNFVENINNVAWIKGMF